MDSMPPSVSAEKPRRLNAKGWLANSMLLLCSLMAGLLLCEIAVRLFAPQPINGIFFDYAPRGYMLTKSEGSAFFSIGENKGIYHFVPPHLRGSNPPPRGAARILALGDSFTFGFGLPDKDTYVARLQEKLDSAFGTDRIALLNAGISGSGTAEHLAFLEDFGDQIAPAAVLVFVSVDDFNRAQRSPLYRLRSGQTLDLDAASVPVGALRKAVVPSEAYNFAIEHLQLAQLIRRAHLWFLSAYAAKSAGSEQSRPVGDGAAKSAESGQLRPIHDSAPDRQRLVHAVVAQSAGSEQLRPSDDGAAKSAGAGQLRPIVDSSPEQQRLVRAMFRRMKAWCDARGIKLAVINNGWRAYEWLADLLASERIAAFDAAPNVLPAILPNRASYVIAGDGHPNAAGAALTADAVWPFVRNLINENNLARKP